MDGLMIPLIAITSEQSRLIQTQKMTGLQTRHCRWDLRQRLMTQEKMQLLAEEGQWTRVVARHPHQQDTGDQD